MNNSNSSKIALQAYFTDPEKDVNSMKEGSQKWFMLRFCKERKSGKLTLKKYTKMNQIRKVFSADLRSRSKKYSSMPVSKWCTQSCIGLRHKHTKHQAKKNKQKTNKQLNHKQNSRNTQNQANKQKKKYSSLTVFQVVHAIPARTSL